MNRESSTELHVVHLGVSGFPYGFGAIQRVLLLHKGLAQAGVKVMVINRKGEHRNEAHPDIPLQGNFEGVDFVYMTDSPYRPESFWERNLQKVKGFYREIRLLRSMKRAGKLDAALLYITGQIGFLFYYWLLSRLIGFRLILNYVEYRSAFEGRRWLTRTNDRLFDAYACRWVDGALPISEHLLRRIEECAPNTPFLKIPVITDLDQYHPEVREEVAPHLVYCGDAKYLELVEFVLDAFERMRVSGVYLHFILGGPQAALAKVQARIDASSRSKYIRLFPNVPHAQVSAHLSSATGLLIPMRPTLQDAARFPHKVGEYVASGSPLITTAFGEIQHYFQDGDSAFIADAYDVESYSQKMDAVFLDLEMAKEVGRNGREVGLKEFDYRVHGRALKSFIAAIAQKQFVADSKVSLAN